MKKYLAQLTLAAVLFAAVITPVKAWILPLLAPGAVYIMNGVAGLTTAAKVALGVSVGVHVAVAAIELTNDGQPPDASKSNVAIQVQIDPNVPLVKPASAATQPPTVPATQEYVQLSTAGAYKWLANICGSGATNYKATPDEVVAAANAAAATHTQGMQCYNGSAGPAEYVSATAYRTWVNFAPGWTDSYVTISRSNGCPSGTVAYGGGCAQQVYTCPANYTLNTSDNICYTTLSEATDSKVRITRTGDTLQADPTDPDTLPDNVTLSNNTVTHKNCGYDASHPCPSGVKPTTTQARVETNGTVSIVSAQANDNSTTSVKKVTVSAPGSSGPGSSPEVTGESESTHAGTGSDTGTLDGTDPAAPGTTVLNLPENMATTDKQCGYDEAHPCKVTFEEGGIPGEFTGTQGADLDAQFDSMVASMQGQSGGAGEGMAVSGILDGLPDSGCTDPSLDATGVNGGAVISLPLCEKNAQIQPIAQWATYIFTAFAIWGLWFRRMGGTS